MFINFLKELKNENEHKQLMSLKKTEINEQNSKNTNS